ncbi:MAG: primosomal protein N' [Candidatus Eisenbacteria bacterium]|uniref:Replication restart protein PriA n=1 Tax=Eiseniibacteriota bacterium TaxID=2212470 RepID=A0A948RV55_UNCEI|nr:primosomal protein N' [Candidatus Eisenbacteria bacterium]MBU1947788.1 primosomal protein N' [Candidatus Eisenbacteria bacterium]MBU2689547.1 primosomal protein N' [Candidatus Eisenbacteria bacterium]
MSKRIALVALPLGLRKPLSYSIPDELEGILKPGHRVLVPLRGRRTHGYVVDCLPAAQAPVLTGRIKPVEALEPDEPLLEGALFKLVRWVADYYACPIGEVFEAALPGQVWKGRARARKTADAQDLPEALEQPLHLTPHQSEVLATILGALPAHRVAEEGAGKRGAPPVFLLHGVTGSGKTEVYLNIAQHLLDQGRGTLMLVPEIAMGTQLVQRFQRRLGNSVGIFHSGMAAGERRTNWWRAREGELPVIVGTRSAAFVPIPRLGAIIIDEEHEGAYKQGDSPRYHGRDVALMRARIEGVVAIAGSATPSLESRHNVDLEKFRYLSMPERVEQRPTACVVMADLRPREEEAHPSDRTLSPKAPDGEQARARAIEVLSQPRLAGEPFSELLLERLRNCLDRKEQAIIFLNRRGHSTSVQCVGCGLVAPCPNCSVILTYHRQGGHLRCHYCGHREEEIRSCPSCGGRDFLYGGFGTQKVESQLRTHMPGARILRMDMDTTRRRGAHREMIGAFEDREIDILVGTQMVGKGLDFPGVTLVGVLLADREMAIPDFRGQERAFQILTQVAGRAGRGDRPGQVILQTFMPDHFVIQAAASQDYEKFYAVEIEERRALGFPPFSRQAHLLLDDPKEERVIQYSERLQQHLVSWIARQAIQGVQIFGPAPMPLERMKGRYRWHLTLRTLSARKLKPVVEEAIRWDEAQRGGVRLIVDVDPLHSL